MTARTALVVLAVGLAVSTVYGSDEIQTWYLSDGTEVLLLEDHRAPIVDIEINFDINRIMPWSVENSAQAAFVGQMFDTNRHIEREIERSGVYLSASMDGEELESEARAWGR